MPPRRKLYKGRRRAGMGKKRYQRVGKWISARVPRVHRIKETYEYQFGSAYKSNPLVAPANTINTGTIAVRAANLANWVSFASVFDLYKITGFKVRFVPRWNASEAQASGDGNSSLPLLHIAPNRDPYVNDPTGVGDILNDDYCKTIPLSKPVSFYLKSPKPAMLTKPATEGDPISLVPIQFNTGNRNQPWLTTGGSNQFVDQSVIDHFGFRWVLDNTHCQAAMSVDTYITLYITLKEQD